MASGTTGTREVHTGLYCSPSRVAIWSWYVTFSTNKRVCFCDCIRSTRNNHRK